MTGTPDLLVDAESAPQAVPLQADPDAFQLIPRESLLVAVKESVWPVTIAARFGETATVIAAGSIVAVRVTGTLCAGLLESVTVKVRALEFAVAVGVPPIVPALPFNDRPAGRDPLVRAQVYGVVPPVARSVAV